MEKTALHIQCIYFNLTGNYFQITSYSKTSAATYSVWDMTTLIEQISETFF